MKMQDKLSIAKKKKNVTLIRAESKKQKWQTELQRHGLYMEQCVKMINK